MPFHKTLSRSHQKAFSRDSRLVQKAREDYYRENCLHFNSENSCDLTHFLEHDQIYWPTRLWNLWDPWNLDGRALIGICQLHPKNPAKSLEVLPSSVPIRVPEGHGLNQYQSSRCTLPFQWGNPLSLLWERRAEWGNDHQSSVDNALQVRPGVQEVLSLSLGHIQGHPAPWLEELPAICGRRPW